jgi:hypothetical protein
MVAGISRGSVEMDPVSRTMRSSKSRIGRLNLLNADCRSKNLDHSRRRGGNYNQ